MTRKTAGILTGLATGFFGGLLGIGGGSIAIPAMIGLLRIKRHKAHATSLAVIAVMAGAAASYYWVRGNMDLKLAGLLFLGSSAGVVLGARILRRVPVRELGIFFSVFIIILAIKMGLDIKYVPVHTQTDLHTVGPLIVLSGMAAGCLSGVLGIGGASVYIPALIYLAGVSQQVAQGVALLVAVPTSLIGTITHYKHGYIEMTVVHWIILGTLFSSILGAYLANIFSAMMLRGIFSVLMLAIGVEMTISCFGKKDGEAGNSSAKGQCEQKSDSV